MSAILNGGDRAGEFLGFDNAQDMTPIGADFSQVLPTDVDGTFQYKEKTPLNSEFLRELYGENKFRGTYFASIAHQYRARGEGAFTSQDATSRSETKITLIFGRSREDAFLKGAEYRGHMREQHMLVPVGLPSTEVSGLIVNGAAIETIKQAKDRIVDSGFYIPIYNLDGGLIFTPEEYDQMKQSNEFDQQVSQEQAV